GLFGCIGLRMAESLLFVVACCSAFCDRQPIVARLTGREETVKSVEVGSVRSPYAGPRRGGPDGPLACQSSGRLPVARPEWAGGRAPRPKVRRLAGAPCLGAGSAHVARRIALLLWEDMPDAQARGNLRQLLAATRRAAPFLEADTGSIGFAAEIVE